MKIFLLVTIERWTSSRQWVDGWLNLEQTDKHWHSYRHPAGITKTNGFFCFFFCKVSWNLGLKQTQTATSSRWFGPSSSRPPAFSFPPYRLTCRIFRGELNGMCLSSCTLSFLSSSSSSSSSSLARQTCVREEEGDGQKHKTVRSPGCLISIMWEKLQTERFTCPKTPTPASFSLPMNEKLYERLHSSAVIWRNTPSFFIQTSSSVAPTDLSSLTLNLLVICVVLNTSSAYQLKPGTTVWYHNVHSRWSERCCFKSNKLRQKNLYIYVIFMCWSLFFTLKKRKKKRKEERFSSLITARKQLLQILVTLLWS